MTPDCCSLVSGSACHCAKCHQTFGNLALFDKHQDVVYGRTPPVLCYEPQKLGLVQDDKGTWRKPETVLGLKRRVGTMRSARSRHAE